MNKFDVFLDTLRQSGCRITPQRRAVCEYLALTDQHPTPYQVYADMVTHHPDISRATVYNTLNTLQRLGAIVEVSFGGDHTHYDTNPAPHVNLICLRCHQIQDADELPQFDLQQMLTLTGDFQPITARVDVLGYCQACQQQRRAASSQQGPVPFEIKEEKHL